MPYIEMRINDKVLNNYFFNDFKEIRSPTTIPTPNNYLIKLKRFKRGFILIS